MSDGRSITGTRITCDVPRHVVVFCDLGRGGVDVAVVQFRLLPDVDAGLLALLEEVVSALVRGVVRLQAEAPRCVGSRYSQVTTPHLYHCSLRLDHLQ